MKTESGSLFQFLDRARHKIPFWWWITYDALVAVVIVVGVEPWSFAFWLGFTTLGIAVVIDTVEFFVKSPWVCKPLSKSEGSSHFDPFIVWDEDENGTIET